MDKNTILIIMPVYNAEDTLAKAIQSILSQTYKNVHLTIVDDASTDNSLQIAKSFLSDERVSVYQNKVNLGAYYSRNFGLYINKKSEWGYFTTHDADDISFKNRYKKIIKMFLANKKINGIQDAFDRIDMETGQVVKSNITMAHAVFLRSVFDEIGYFDNVRFGGDWEHWYRLGVHNSINELMTTSSIKEIMGESYIHDTNLTVQIPENSKRRTDYVKRSKKRIERLQRSSLYYDYEPERGFTRRVS